MIVCVQNLTNAVRTKRLRMNKYGSSDISRDAAIMQCI